MDERLNGSIITLGRPLKPGSRIRRREDRLESSLYTDWHRRWVAGSSVQHCSCCQVLLNLLQQDKQQLCGKKINKKIKNAQPIYIISQSVSCSNWLLKVAEQTLLGFLKISENVFKNVEPRWNNLIQIKWFLEPNGGKTLKLVINGKLK